MKTSVCNFSTALPEKKLKKKKKYVKNNKENNVIFKSTARTSQNIQQTEYSLFSIFSWHMLSAELPAHYRDLSMIRNAIAINLNFH